MTLAEAKNRKAVWWWSGLRWIPSAILGTFVLHGQERVWIALRPSGFEHCLPEALEPRSLALQGADKPRPRCEHQTTLTLDFGRTT